MLPPNMDTGAGAAAATAAAAPHGLQAVLEPRSVAVFGASDDRAKFGGRILYYLLKGGFAGRVVPINPNRATVGGLPAIGDIRQAGPIDVAILAVPASVIEESIAACAQAGVRACVIVTAGFAEIGEQGAALQRRLTEIAGAAGMRLVGPNCMGIINSHHRMALTSSLVMDKWDLEPGGVGLVSQSGALMVSMFDRARADGIRFSVCASIGNQSDLEVCDFFEHLIDDPRTRVITMYVEGFVDAPRFARLAQKAKAAGKPVLLTKTGRTEAGMRAARSHTASLAGSYRVLEAVCRKYGVVLLDDPDGMLQLAAVLERFGPPSAPGIAIVSPSGGAIGIAVDRLGDVGLSLAELDDASQSELRRFMNPSHAFNPVDLGNRIRSDLESVAGVVRAVSTSPQVGLVFVILTTSPDFERVTRQLATAAIAGGKAVLFLVTPGPAADGCRAVLSELRMPYVNRLDDAIRILKSYLPLAQSAVAARPARRPDDLPAPAEVRAAVPAGAVLNEKQVKALLTRYGVPVARESLCTSADAAVVAAGEIGYPVVLKAMSAQLVHKSDIGAVRLDLADAAAVREAWRAIEAALDRTLPAATLDGCLVAPMIRAQSELIVGCRHDVQFGPVVLVGFGGVTVELFADTRLAPAPIDPAAAQALLRGLRQWPLLDGYRGRPRAGIEAIADIVSRISWLAADLGNRLLELDVNPLLVRQSDGSPVAVDARATIAAQAVASTATAAIPKSSGSEAGLPEAGAWP
jgi:acyl-CoA synthetase (NDP forming)